MKKNTSKTNIKESKFSIGRIVSTLITAYFTAALLQLPINLNEAIEYPSLDFLQDSGNSNILFSQIFWIICISGILLLIDRLYPNAKITPHTLLISTFLLSATVLLKSGSSLGYTYLTVIAVLAIVILYATKEGCFTFIKKDVKPFVMWIGVGAFAFIFGYVIAGIGVLRQLTYSTPNFDFGIFCNMYHNMAETGLPNVTCERDQLLSHFAVHFSPIFYLLLPIYYVFPSAITLQVSQTLILYSGIIPLVLIAKKKGLSNISTVILSGIYAAYPAIGTGTFYDMHENCFLIPILLWLFFFYEKEKYMPMAIFGLLTLAIKEDAFIYLLIFAIYVLIADKKWKIALPVFGFALVYFLIVSSMMKTYGTGIMSNRFENLMYNMEDGLLGVLKTAILNPGYLFTQIFATTKGNTDKIWYVLQLLLPLGFIPFATKKISRYILIVPILMNLITMYQYSPNINFQYSFGIIAFLFYASVLNLSELKGFSKNYLMTFALVSAMLLFFTLCVPKYSIYHERLEKNGEMYERYDYALTEVLPEDASVAASSFLVTHICDRDEIYEVKYHKVNGKYKTDIEYVVLDMRYKDESNDAASFYLANGYEEFYFDSGVIWILKKTS